MGDTANAALPIGINVLSPEDMRPKFIDFMGVVRVYRDGSVAISDGKEPDDAARAFWTAVRTIAPEFLKP